MDSASHQTLDVESSSKAFTSLLAVCISFLVLNIFFVLARFYTVLVLRKSKEGLWWDDFFIIPSYSCNLGMIIIALKTREIFLRLPLTGHESILAIDRYSDLQSVLKLVYALTNLLMAVLFTTRVSIMALYLRIFSGRKVRLAIYVVSALVVLQWFACQLVALMICVPVNRWWDPRNVKTGRCINVDEFYRTISYPIIVLDVFLIILPLPTVWQLQTSRLRKLCLSLLFLTSVLALVASAYRTYVIQTHNTATLSPASTNVLMVWLIGETGMYLIVACLPAMAPLITLCIPARLSDRAMGTTHHLQSRSPQRSDFARLVDADVSARAVAESENKGIEMHERAATPTGSSSLNASDVEHGHGVLVHTEIIVTQEEKISNVLGI